VDEGHKIEAWTLNWDSETQVLSKMRSKETEADYRYFREPDLLPLRISEEWRNSVLATMPESPIERRTRFMEQYILPEYDADILTGERNLSNYFEAAVVAYGGNPKRVSNWLLNDVMRMLNEQNKQADQLNLTPAYLVEIIKLVDAKTVNTTTGKVLLDKVETSDKSPIEIVKTEGLVKVNDSDVIRNICGEIVAENPEQVASYKKGKVTLIGWFVGQVMSKSGGKADPAVVRAILEELLAK
jgi:aspartyl-tRNA(Asn)/glutamyl-tRNA(Gln) amidotransferase subunit B